ncbi:nucleoside triphosphate pyrophosphohydrolase [Rossellomorea vietnamensis]|uniref:nucleoside triphosphate pyrophosphohydrolase n=1 Tax=Rossellomorea vietnamensis TaxID=218284 RepID=UPI001E4BF954|nr:nucleoside triphosphate pyrophosphohydrolase [Rossellomorea vietnamensis]MCC5803791.1 nucleoside triphosphate pyrophosphohydrolase [Rossellomorea vietnamensis]
MPTYNKLIRDKIPQIIKSKGKEFSTKILNDEDYIKYLKEKAYEELDEYCAAETDGEAVEELADLLEVVRALSKQHGSTIEKVEKVRKNKAKKRGGFEEKVFLIGVED